MNGWRACRCCSCGGYVTYRCDLCRGHPIASVTVERLARARAAVDRATEYRPLFDVSSLVGLVASHA